MSNRQHEHEILGFDVPIEGDVTGAAARDYELPQSLFHGPAYERVALQHSQCVVNQGDRRCRLPRILLDEEIRKSFKIR